MSEIILTFFENIFSINNLYFLHFFKQKFGNTEIRLSDSLKWTLGLA